MFKTANCYICGESFNARNERHVYCSCDCKREARRIRERQQGGRYKRGTKKPVVTIAMMDDAATMLSKELGKYVSYGRVQKDLAIGKLVVSGGRIVKAGDHK